MDGLPLALQQAGAYIVRTGTTIADFVTEYITSKAKLMTYLQLSIDDKSGGIRTTWTMSFKQIQERGEFKTEYANAANLLRLWIFLDYRGVSFELLVKGNQGPGVPLWFSSMLASKPEFHKTISVLRGFSLIEFTEGEDSYSMHRILHDWCAWFLPKDEDNSDENLGLAARIVGYAVPEWSDHNQEDAERRLLLHADVMYDSIVRAIPIIPSRRKILCDPSRDNYLSELDHPLRQISRLYQNQGHPEKAERLVRQVLELLRRENGPDDELTVLFELELASILCTQDPEETVKLATHVLEQFNHEPCPNYPHALTASNILAIMYDQTGRTREAIETYRDLTNTSSSALGRTHFRTLIFVENLGLTLMSDGQYGEAISCFKDSLARRKTAPGLGPEHPRTAQTMLHLADAYQKNGDWDEAEKIVRELSALYSKRFGPHHIDTLQSQDRLAIILMRNGKTGEAMKLTESLIQLLETVSVPAYTAGCLHYNFGARCKAHGDLARAEAAFKRAAIEFRNDGSEVDVMDSYEELISMCVSGDRMTEAEQHISSLLLSLERWNGNDPDKIKPLVLRPLGLFTEKDGLGTSEQWYEKVVARFGHVLGQDHDVTLSATGSYATWLQKNERSLEAASIFRHILPLFKARTGESSELNVLVTLEGLADSLSSIDEEDEAINLFQRVLFLSLNNPVFAKAAGKNLASDMELLAGLYEKVGHLEESEILVTKAVEAPDLEPEELAGALFYLGVICLKRKRYAKARTHLKAAIEVNAKVEAGPAATRSRLAALDELGMTYEEQGRYQDAEEYIKEAANGFDEQFGPDDQDCVIALKNWARISASLGKFDMTRKIILRLDSSKNTDSRLDMGTICEVWKQCGRRLFQDDAEEWLRLAGILCTKYADRTANGGKTATVAKTVLADLRKLHDGETGQRNHRVQLYLMLFGANIATEKIDNHDTWFAQKALLLAAALGHTDIIRAITSAVGIDLDWEGSLEDCKILPSGTDVKTIGGRFFPSEYSALTIAASEGHLEAIQFLLDNGASASSRRKGGWTPLHGAASCLRGSVKAVELLLDTGADISASTDEGFSVLHAAASLGDPDVLQILISRGATAKASYKPLDRTPLHLAVINGREEAVRLLVQNTANLDAKDAHELTALHIAVCSGEGVVAKLLISLGADKETRNMLGCTLLESAFLTNHPIVAYLLLDEAGDKKEISWKLLNTVTKYEKEEIIQLLLDAGGDIDLKDDKRGFTLLHCRSVFDDVNTARKLLRFGISTEARDRHGRTALSIAALEGSTDIVDLLLARDDVDPNSGDNTKRTPLFQASCGGEESVVRKLLDDKRVNADPVDHYGSSALSLAVRHGHEKVVKLLLESGRVNVYSRDTFGRTPLWYAKKYGETKIASLLLSEIAKSETPEIDQASASLNPSTRCNSSLTCDVCTLGIDRQGGHYHCGDCSGGDFDICSDCFENGARCLGTDHHITRKGDGANAESLMNLDDALKRLKELITEANTPGSVE